MRPYQSIQRKSRSLAHPRIRVYKIYYNSWVIKHLL
ncbi:unnamed protein product [Acanthoscelides obtectus]|uniref:Uncharacterized protein n=1 Tax=Acanthoscelides obtectus TaxID=200917 RepID=A0A9P0PMB1_ACAOB|nr:unnamed protein product [Acanthoscelides obtectus]CAK1649727.1 hypothetical protein AOBTE_LOCUS16384 [Acanthoscelides obtectus]